MRLSVPKEQMKHVKGLRPSGDCSVLVGDSKCRVLHARTLSDALNVKGMVDKGALTRGIRVNAQFDGISMSSNATILA